MISKLLFISILFSFIFITHSCLHHQKTLLLQFKDELSFNSSRSTKLVQWNESEECCKWHGVECDAVGYVVSLQLDNESIYGGIADSSSLFRLVHLQKLNLAYNDFNNTPIPKGIRNLSYLTHLNLSHADFGGQVPAEISSLRRLVSLDISSEYPILGIPSLSLEYPILEMLVQNLTGLQELYLDDVTSSDYERRKWSHIISSNLPNLTALSLRECGLSGPLAKSFWKLHSLSILRLDWNDLGTQLPDLFANFPSLTTLSLLNCSLKGSIPPTFANLTNLIHLDLSNNFFAGSLSSALFEGLSNLVYLDLSYNSFSGNIPHSLLALPSLLELHLSGNQFNGTLQLDSFRSLANLTQLDLSYNRLSVDVGNINSTSYGSLQLKVLKLASCNMSRFPNFTKPLDLKHVDLSDNGIGGEIPSWIWGTQLVRLNLSFNLLTDMQKPYHILPSLQYLDLQSNQLRGELYLPIPPASGLFFLSVANNSFSGSIPTSLCSATSLFILDLSSNRLSGSIPPCLLENNADLDLSQNNISGSIPDNFPMYCNLGYLDLSSNTLEGKIPKSLERCEQLRFMNIGNNNINDSFPCMLSSNLHFLVLRSNKFYGEVRCHEKRWPDLQILDISSNHFSGNLESINFSTWKTMMLQSDEQLRHANSMYYRYLWRSPSVTLIMKGINLEFHWPEFCNIDLSCNNFGGEIPTAIGDLTLLHQLNFSHNSLNGSIPNSFGQLRNLESLDLSANRLMGLIPVELAGLTFLQVLNLSYNKLVGEIPNGHQLQTFPADSFIGNPGLCGFNLNISCSPSDGSDHLWPQEDENGEEKSEIEWEYVSSALGYVVGLGSIAWMLLCRRSFRERYFEKIEEMVDKIFYERARRRRHERRRRRVEMRNEVRRQRRS